MKHQKIYKQHYKKLNPAQKEAVDTIEGAVMVIAGPGTGKTQILTLRIANILLKTQVGPENILALTFTESGVHTMRRRLIEIIGSTAYSVNIFTFHGFCNHVIQSNPDKFPDLIAAEPATELEQIEIFEEIFANSKLNSIKPRGNSTVYVKPALQAITELKRENIQPADFAKVLQKQQKEFEKIPDLYHDSGRWEGKMKGKYKKEKKELNKNKELLEIYRQYQKTMRAQNLYDFEDMLLFVIDKLQNDKAFLRSQQEQYHYFLLDEHQDTNRAQNKIVELLASFHPNPNVFAVGDEKQAIYRFQGATLANFLYLKEKYPQARLINLSNNYRSTQTILDAAYQLISHNPLPAELDLPLREELKAQNTNKKQTINLVELSDYHAEYHYVAKDIAKKIEEGADPEEITILARNNADLQELIPALHHYDVPFVLEAKQDILKYKSIKTFLLLLKAVDQLDSDEALLKLMHLNLFAIHPRDIIHLQRHAKNQESTLWEILDHKQHLSLKLIKPKKITRLYQRLIEWKKLEANKSLDEVFTTLLKDSGLLKTVLDQADFIKAVNRLITLYTQLQVKLDHDPELKLSRFLKFLDLVEKHNLRIAAKSTSSHQESVRLMTAHGAKGMEFNRVYILNCYDKKWGNKNYYGARFKLPFVQMGTSLQEPEEAEKSADERRLFYVALTRARHSVTVSYANTSLDGAQQLPSRFISELPSNKATWESPRKFQEWFSKNKANIFTTAKQKKQPPQKSIKETRRTTQQIFNRRGFSVSALNNYLSCPWKYYFRNLVRLPEAKNRYLIFGSAVHNTLHRFLVKLNKQEQPDLKQVKNIFAHYLSRQPLTRLEREELKRDGDEALEFYYQKRMKYWEADLISEKYISGVGLEPDIKLTGKLDMLEALDKPENLRVYDFKTGRPKSRNWIEGKTKNSTGDYKRQLVFYKLLLDRFEGGKFKMKQGVIEFVEPTKSDKLKSESFKIKSEETNRLKELIQDAAEQIRNLEFWHRFCDDSECNYCRLRKLMD